LKTSGPGQEIWPADSVQVEVDEATIRAQSELPKCPACAAIARPNILMFDDWAWDDARTSEQFERYEAWLRRAAGRRMVAIEIGAGLAIPTVRRECEARGDLLIRINPREAETRAGGISLAMGAMEGLAAIDMA
jgi:NAD-dependent SIR2 family protein deacetylase